MSTRTRLFVFDWWVVQKRVVYLLVAILILCGIAVGGALYVWKYGNPLKNVGTGVKLASGARFISFEGDVRVIRSATRETVIPGADTELYPGDTVQTQASGRARVSMADGSTLVVRPNSTIIVRDNASEDDGKKTNVHVVVDSGQMYVRTEQQTDGTITSSRLTRQAARLAQRRMRASLLIRILRKRFALTLVRSILQTRAVRKRRCMEGPTSQSILRELFRPHKDCSTFRSRLCHAIWKSFLLKEVVQPASP